MLVENANDQLLDVDMPPNCLRRMVVVFESFHGELYDSNNSCIITPNASAM